MNRFILIPALVLVLFMQVSTTHVLAQEGHKIVTRTRLQVLFGDLETQWLKAVQQKDAELLDHLLSDEFAVWTPGPPDSPAPRDEWQPETFNRPPQAFRIENVSVRAVSPTVSVVSFRLIQTFGQGDSQHSETSFVVDVWVNSGKGDNWKCSDRYISRVTDGAQNSKEDVKPTGKD